VRVAIAVHTNSGLFCCKAFGVVGWEVDVYLYVELWGGSRRQDVA